jgi:hypothetical protein
LVCSVTDSSFATNVVTVLILKRYCRAIDKISYRIDKAFTPSRLLNNLQKGGGFAYLKLGVTYWRAFKSLLIEVPKMACKCLLCVKNGAGVTLAAVDCSKGVNVSFSSEMGEIAYT